MDRVNESVSTIDLESSPLHGRLTVNSYRVTFVGALSEEICPRRLDGQPSG